ncbi:hypothetical protein [Bradyrhizobium ottawaense]|uniref:hypothetical protein n=1 Tax=Bradyrhizobium ottawaense TaxID=931866 RepID=UPI0027D5D1FB|nr:hypothetical protein BwSG10_68670 [Bradyrhizobium ottawaense]GMP00222.1 hypothetical protein BwSH20_28060 [Bradyrhizobium ottawaense]GMP11667.1 hypothetical protein BwDG23_68670 [Bradyrhizobium ottawaense]GMP15816.1 hypothetical protein BwSH12_18180 [Bradyrhizobium ottawaense]
MSNPFQPAIEELEKELNEIERQRTALISTINLLRGKAGMPPRQEASENGGQTASGGGGQHAAVAIRHDTFFGKRMATAARTYLEMRRAAEGGTSPATPRDIFDALKKGGFVFETKDDGVAIISLRNMLRKNTVVFQKLPNGTYGLAAWYPNAKKPKGSLASLVESPFNAATDDADDDGDDAATTETKAAE